MFGLAENMSVFYPRPETLQVTEITCGKLINLAVKISMHSCVQAVALLVLVKFTLRNNNR